MFKWIKNLFGVKNKSVFQDEEIQAEAQRHSEEIRKLRAEVRRAEYEQKLLHEQMKLERIQDSSRRLTERLKEQSRKSEPEDDSAMETMLMTLFMKILLPQPAEIGLNNVPQAPQPVQTTLTPPTQETKAGSKLTTQEIKTEIAKIPKVQKAMIQRMSDESIKSFIRKNFDYDEETINKTISILRGREVVEAS